MKKQVKTLLAAMIGALVSGQVMAIDELHSFSAGSAAKAQEVNENFAYLETKINALGSDVATMDVDCGADNTALSTALANARFAGPLTITVTGTCTGPIDVMKDDVTINDATIDGELSISGRSNISLYNVRIQNEPVFISRGSFVRFNSVTMQTTPPVDGEEFFGNLYEGNVEVRSSTLRIESGSLSNLSLVAGYNSYIRINEKVKGEAFQIWLENNSSLQSKRDSLDVNHTIFALNNSTIEAKEIISDNILMVHGSLLHANKVVAPNWIEANQGAVINIEGGSDPLLTAKAMECHGSNLYIDGEVSFTGTDPEAGGKAFEAHHGCSGEIGSWNLGPDDYNVYKSPLELMGLGYIEDIPR